MDQYHACYRTKSPALKAVKVAVQVAVELQGMTGLLSIYLSNFLDKREHWKGFLYSRFGKDAIEQKSQSV